MLQALRKALNLTQEAMAELFSIKQANASKVEKSHYSEFLHYFHF